MPGVYPSLPQEPGSFQAKFKVDGSSFPGSIDLVADGMTKFEYFDDGRARRPGGYPEEAIRLPRVLAKLRSNVDVLLGDAVVEEWFPGRFHGVARYVLVGLGVNEAESYEKIEFQIDGLDALFGRVPIETYGWPNSDGTEFTATIRAPLSVTWSDDSSQLDFCYEWSLRHLDGYRLVVAFAPKIYAQSTVGLSVDTWLRDWIIPMSQLTAFATGRPSRLSWALLRTGDNQGGHTGQLYGSGVHQQPYEATRPTPMEDGRPLFTCFDSKVDALTLLKRWKGLIVSDNPFPELYQLTTSPGLPMRARFLYLVQALEGLHDHEFGPSGDQRDAYKSRRSAVIAESTVKLGALAAEWLTNNIDRRLGVSLERRIKHLVDKVPPSVQTAVKRVATDDPLAERNRSAGRSHFHQIVAATRNALSHGGPGTPNDRELRPWVENLDVLAKAHLMRLLCFSDSEIARAFDEPSF